MSHLMLGAAQLGGIGKEESRAQVVERLLVLLRRAADRGCRAVVFPELALTTFFPRWYTEDQAELDRYFEVAMPGPETKPLFDEAARLGVGFYLGYAELERDGGETQRYNTSILVDEAGEIVGKYRKVHLPGHHDHVPDFRWQHLEKRYFEPGNLGFPVFRAFGALVGMCICNDRRWPETFRVMGLQGAEIVMLGFNTPTYDFGSREPEHLRMFHHKLSIQAGAYQNATWIVATAKAGREEDADLIGGTCIVAPTGEIVAEAVTLGDELVTHDCDLELGTYIRAGILNLGRHRRIEHYGLITAQRGVIEPPEED